MLMLCIYSSGDNIEIEFEYWLLNTEPVRGSKVGEKCSRVLAQSPKKFAETPYFLTVNMFLVSIMPFFSLGIVVAIKFNIQFIDNNVR